MRTSAKQSGDGRAAVFKGFKHQRVCYRGDDGSRREASTLKTANTTAIGPSAAG
jgi:hypothetical protein